MTGMPLEGSGFGMGFTLVGNPTYTDPSQRPGAGFGMVTPDYFQIFGIRLVRGRVLSEADTASTVKIAVVNEDFVRKYLKDSDPLQQRISVEQLIPGVIRLGPPVVWQMVGVYHKEAYTGDGGPTEATVSRHAPLDLLEWKCHLRSHSDHQNCETKQASVVFHLCLRRSLRR
jgi:hypothetical protein